MEKQKMDPEARIEKNSFSIRMLQGFLVGTGAILPGISGGVMAVILGLYEKLLQALATLFSDFKKSFLYLLPIGIGGVIGILITGGILKGIFTAYRTQLTILFSGFVLGDLPWLFLEAKGKSRFKAKYFLCFVVGLALILLSGKLHRSAPDTKEFITIGECLLSGAAIAVGVILPGVSATFLLIYLGTYSAVLAAISGISIRALFFLGIGFAAASALLLLLMYSLLRKDRAAVYFAVIGFSLGSMWLVLPELLPDLTWMCPMLFIFGLCMSLIIGFARANRLGLTYECPTDVMDIFLAKKKPASPEKKED